MVMTGIYAGTSDSVVITAAIETFIINSFEQNMFYDGKDLRFYCCSDGLVIDVPIIGTGWSTNHFPLMLSYRLLKRESTQYEADLKAIYDATTPSTDMRRTKYKEILVL